MARPLTDAQERALIALADHADKYDENAFSKPPGVQAPTLYALARLGLVKTQERPTTVIARITSDGLDLLHSMGD